MNLKDLNQPKIFAKWTVVFGLLLFVLTACNKDDVIEDLTPEKPVITLDSETGIYQVKIGREITISPLVENADGAIYSWIIDSKLVGTSPSLTISYDRAQDVYVTFRVETLAGTAEEEIKIEVVDFAPPIISLMMPSTGIKVLPNTDYVLSPDFQNKDEEFSCKWMRDGKTVSEGETYTFNEKEVGSYPISIVATNMDGETTKDIIIEVVDQLPYNVYFDTPSYFQTTTDRNTVVGRPSYLTPRLEYIDNPRYTWFVDGEKIDCTDKTYKFTPTKTGDYTITVEIVDDFSRVETTFKASAIVHCYASANAKAKTANSNKCQNKVYEFVPAPGQFINETGKITDYTGNERTHADAIAYATRRLEEKKFVSLGGFGGYIVVGFDHSVIAGSGEYDFSIEGNAFSGSNEPGIIWVMEDTNGNGLPDDEWYELRGSETGKAGTIQDYAVTYYRPAGPGMHVQWTDSEGKSGRVDYLSQYHNQPYYYPNWITADSYTLRGTRLNANNTVDPATGYWANNNYAWGYADNLGSDALVGGDAVDGSKQRNGFKISNAMFADGTPVKLTHIDFVKVQVGTNAKSGALGENSTEVFSFEDLSM